MCQFAILGFLWSAVRLSWLLGCTSTNTTTAAYKQIIGYQWNVSTFSDDNILLGWKDMDKHTLYIVVPDDTSDVILFRYVKKYGSLLHDIVFMLVDMNKFDLADVQNVMQRTTFLDRTRQDNKRVIAIVCAHRLLPHGLLLAAHKLPDLRQHDHREVPLSDVYRIVNILSPKAEKAHNKDSVTGYTPRNVHTLAALDNNECC